MGRRPGGARALPRRHRRCPHRDRDDAVPGGPLPADPAGAAGAARPLRRDGLRHVRCRGDPAHANGQVRHVGAGHRCDGLAEAAAQEARGGQGSGQGKRQGCRRTRERRPRHCRRAADEDAAPAAEDPALHPGHRAGRTRLFHQPAVLAGRIAGQHCQPGPLSDRPLCAGRASRAARRGTDGGAARLSGNRRLPPEDGPRRRGRQDGAQRRRIAQFRHQRQARHRRPVADAFLSAGRQCRPLQRRHHRLRSARAAGDPGLRHRARPAPGDRRFLSRGGPSVDRCAGLADRLLARRRTGLQRRSGRRGGAREARSALPGRHAGRVPDAGPMGRLVARPAAGGSDDDGRDPGTRRGHRLDGLRRSRQCAADRLHRLRACLPVRTHQRRPRHAQLHRPRRCTGGPGGPARRSAAQRACAAQGRRGHLQLSAQRRRHRHGGLPVGVRVAVQRIDGDGPLRLHRGAARQRRRAARTPRHRQCSALRRDGERARPHQCRRPRAAREAPGRDRGPMGSGAGQATVRRQQPVRARRTFRQRLRRHPARLRLRRRPDAAAVREGLRADPRLLGLLPLAARGLRRRRGAALRHPRRARIHAGQAERTLGPLLARPADRRPAELLPVCVEQPVRRHDRQAPCGCDLDQLPDAAGGTGRAVQGPRRPEGPDRAPPRPGARCPARTRGPQPDDPDAGCRTWS